MRSAGRPVSLLGTLISRWRTSSPWELKQPNLLLNTERSPGWYGQSSITSAFQPLLFCFLLQCCCSKKQEVFKKKPTAIMWWLIGVSAEAAVVLAQGNRGRHLEYVRPARKTGRGGAFINYQEETSLCDKSQSQNKNVFWRFLFI